MTTYMFKKNANLYFQKSETINGEIMFRFFFCFQNEKRVNLRKDRGRERKEKFGKKVKNANRCLKKLRRLLVSNVRTPTHQATSLTILPLKLYNFINHQAYHKCSF